MTLSSIALNNMKRNFKNYWAFFLSSTFSVFVLYLFISIVNNSNIEAQLGDKRIFALLFNLASHLIAFFSAFFIWYSNSFSIKSRKKEFATYMLLGMSKKQTAYLNLIENLIIMVGAFCAGIVLGLIFNKFFIMLLYVMIKATGNVQYVLSLKSLKYCFIVFTSVFIIISIHSSILIYKNNLIDLFNASKKAEKGLKISFFTLIVATASIICLGYGYYLAIKKLSSNIFLSPIVILLVIIGTLLLFIGLTSMLIYLSKKNEERLFKGTKLISTSQLYYRYKGNVGTLSVIAITTTVALCALTTCFGLLDKTEENSRYMRPFSIEYINSNDSTDETFKNTLKTHKKISVKYKDNISFLQIKAKHPLSGDNETFLMLNESEFDKINNHEKTNKKANLKDEEDCYLLELSSSVTNTKILNRNVSFNAGGKKYNLKITATDNRPFISLDRFKQTLIVKENIYNQIKNAIPKENTFEVTGYILENDFLTKDFILDLKNKLPKESIPLTFYEHYMDSIQMLGMMSFIGIFIGLLFLTATGSIMYFKISMEAQEDKNKFITLMKIGVSKSELRKAISKELIVLFSMPLLVAIINAYVASIPIGMLMAFKITKEFIIIILVYSLLYSIFYFITLNSYIKTISKESL